MCARAPRFMCDQRFNYDASVYKILELFLSCKAFFVFLWGPAACCEYETKTVYSHGRSCLCLLSASIILRFAASSLASALILNISRFSERARGII